MTIETKLFQGDCLEIMKDIPAHSVDMILCDLPYGTTRCKWDSVISFDAMWEQYLRVVKENGCIALFADEPFASALIMSNPKLFRYELIWVKDQGTDFLNANRKPLKKHEKIEIFYQKQPCYNKQLTEGRPYKAVRGWLRVIAGVNLKPDIKPIISAPGIQQRFSNLIRSVACTLLKNL